MYLSIELLNCKKMTKIMLCRYYACIYFPYFCCVIRCWEIPNQIPDQHLSQILNYWIVRNWPKYRSVVIRDGFSVLIIIFSQMSIVSIDAEFKNAFVILHALLSVLCCMIRSISFLVTSIESITPNFKPWASTPPESYKRVVKTLDLSYAFILF